MSTRNAQSRILTRRNTHTQSNRRAYAHSIMHSCTRALAHRDQFLPIILRRRLRVYKRRIIDRFVISSVPEKNQRLIPIGLAILRTLAKSDFRSRASFRS